MARYGQELFFEEIKMFDIWNHDEQIAIEQYKKDNYLIHTYAPKGVCVIFCSSNNIWFPNTEEAFKQCLIDKNRFEWTNFHLSNVGKEIFIRDIYKSWYVIGINTTVDSIDKLVDFLKKETYGYKIILIGSSAGGYIASLLGTLLEAEYVIAFSAQFDLRNQWTNAVNPFLRKFENDYEKSRYYDLVPILMNSNTPIYYIVPIKSDQDNYQYNHVKSLSCISPIVFKSKHHGIVILKGNLQHFLSLSQQELEKLYEKNKNRMISSICFSLQLDGVIGTFFSSIKQMNMYLKILREKIKKVIIRMQPKSFG